MERDFTALLLDHHARVVERLLGVGGEADIEQVGALVDLDGEGGHERFGRLGGRLGGVVALAAVVSALVFGGGLRRCLGRRLVLGDLGSGFGLGRHRGVDHEVEARQRGSRAGDQAGGVGAAGDGLLDRDHGSREAADRGGRKRHRHVVLAGDGGRDGQLLGHEESDEGIVGASWTDGGCDRAERVAVVGADRREGHACGRREVGDVGGGGAGMGHAGAVVVAADVAAVVGRGVGHDDRELGGVGGEADRRVLDRLCECADLTLGGIAAATLCGERVEDALPGRWVLREGLQQLVRCVAGDTEGSDGIVADAGHGDAQRCTGLVGCGDDAVEGGSEGLELRAGGIDQQDDLGGRHGGELDGDAALERRSRRHRDGFGGTGTAEHEREQRSEHRDGGDAAESTGGAGGHGVPCPLQPLSTASRPHTVYWPL